MPRKGGHQHELLIVRSFVSIQKDIPVNCLSNQTPASLKKQVTAWPSHCVLKSFLQQITMKNSVHAVHVKECPNWALSPKPMKCGTHIKKDLPQLRSNPSYVRSLLCTPAYCLLDWPAELPAHTEVNCFRSWKGACLRPAVGCGPWSSPPQRSESLSVRASSPGARQPLQKEV